MRNPTASTLSSSRASSWRDNLPIAAVNIFASLFLLAVCVKATHGEAKLNDFYREAWPAYSALAKVHILSFFHLAPAYAGSLVLRAPFALVPAIAGGGPRAAYFASAVPCVTALAVLATWLTVQLTESYGPSRTCRLGPFVCCILNPIVLVALLGGHPEDVFGGVLCVAAVACAARQRAVVAGLLIALAAFNKPWAFLAVPIVIALLSPDRRRVGIVLGAAVLAGGSLLIMASLKGGSSGAALGTQLGAIFNPPQLLWWFGAHSWITAHARFAIFFGAGLCCLLWWWRRRAPRNPSEAMLLLALVMLLRAAFDPWNNLYYHLPFLIAFAAYEMQFRRVPVLSLVYTYVLLFLVPVGGVLPMTNDLHAAVYAGVIAPTLAWLVFRVLSPARNPATDLQRRVLGRPWAVRPRRLGLDRG